MRVHVFRLIDSGSQLITQSSTLTYGHDGKGSVRVLFDAAATIAQVFTYSAYGELLAIHNSSGLLTPNTSPLTAYLYNGEGIDTRTGLYNMRARWYSASNARWERLDPYSGNPTDPFSFHKYGFVHGEPIGMTDPTGLFLAGGLGAIGITGFNFGTQGLAVYAARVGLMTGLQTGFEYFITQQIYSWFLPGEQDDTDWSYAYATNYISNFATGGLKAAFHVKFIIDTLINTISDVSIGKFSWLSLAVRAAVFAGSEGLRKAGTKLLAKYADDVADAFPRGSLSKIFDGHVANQGFSAVIDLTKKKLLLVPSTYSDDIPTGWVNAQGGHGAVSRMLGGNRADHWGFAAILQSDGTLRLRWISRTLNQTADNQVPANLRQEIIEAVEKMTGKTVSSS
jgi:RHS repeat-associated protein